MSVDNPPGSEPPAGLLQAVTADYRPPKAKKPRRSRKPSSPCKPPSFRDRWLDEIERSPQITDSARCLLFTLARHDYMDEDGYTEVKQEDLAARLNKPIRRLYDRYQGAIAAGFLLELGRGGSGGAVRYQAVIPVRRQSVMRDKTASNM